MAMVCSGHGSHRKVAWAAAYHDGGSECSLSLPLFPLAGARGWVLAVLNAAELHSSLAVVSEGVTLLCVVVHATEELDAVLTIGDAITIGIHLIGGETTLT